MSYKDTTRKAYAADLRQWFSWCDLFDTDVLQAPRVLVDAWATHLRNEGDSIIEALDEALARIRAAPATGAANDPKRSRCGTGRHPPGTSPGTLSA